MDVMQEKHQYSMCVTLRAQEKVGHFQAYKLSIISCLNPNLYKALFMVFLEKEEEASASCTTFNEEVQSSNEKQKQSHDSTTKVGEK